MRFARFAAHAEEGAHCDPVGTAGHPAGAPGASLRLREELLWERQRTADLEEEAAALRARVAALERASQVGKAQIVNSRHGLDVRASLLCEDIMRVRVRARTCACTRAHTRVEWCNNHD